MRQAAEQTKIYENSLIIINKTIRKNQLTIKQLETVPPNRNVYVPLGRAYFWVNLVFWRGAKTLPLLRSMRPARSSNRTRRTWRRILSTMGRKRTKNTRYTNKRLRSWRKKCRRRIDWHFSEWSEYSLYWPLRHLNNMIIDASRKRNSSVPLFSAGAVQIRRPLQIQP